MNVSCDDISVDETISLTALRTADAERLFALVDNDREYLAAWLPWVKHTLTVADSLQFVEESVRKQQAGEEYHYGIVYKNERVGCVGLKHVKDEKDPEIGYWVASKASGQGIASRVAAALTKYGFDALDLSKIVILAQPENIASNAVAKKVGYVLSGTAYNAEEQYEVNVWTKLRS